jgi:NADH:ubiquinone oxidoreductase subunit K
VTTVAYLYLGAILFVAGALGTLIRANAGSRLIGVELMFAAATLTFVASAVGFRELDGQVAAILIIAVAIAHAAVGFSLVVGPRGPA